MTDALYYGTRAKLKLGVDGYRPKPSLTGDSTCCPDSLCEPTCDLICSIVDLLPSGPMWDRAKQEATAYFAGGGDYDPCNVYCSTYPCPTLVSYAIYGGRLLSDQVSNVLWPAIRESDPTTAYTTIDDWLDRFGWTDCYRSYCVGAYASALSPYTKINDCGQLEYCPTNFSTSFELALKHAIVVSLSRARHGVIKNIAGINWVIEPLRTTLQPLKPWPEGYQRELAGNCDLPDGPECYCDEAEFELVSSSELLPAGPSLTNPCNASSATVASLQSYTCGDTTKWLYPSVVAADCIVRSLMNRKCPNILFRAEVTQPTAAEVVVIPPQPQIE